MEAVDNTCVEPCARIDAMVSKRRLVGPVTSFLLFHLLAAAPRAGHAEAAVKIGVNAGEAHSCASLPHYQTHPR